MNLEELARDQLARGGDRWRDARRAFRDGRWPDTVRFSQEAVELALKGLLRALAVEVPKRHDVGPVLEQMREELPNDLRDELPEIVRLSAALADRRALAMYGEEATGRPARQLFADRQEAKGFLEGAGRVVRRVGEAFRAADAERSRSAPLPRGGPRRPRRGKRRSAP